MILLLPEDLIDENNFKKVYDLIDSACLGINFPVTDENGNKIGIKEFKRREALKGLEELEKQLLLKSSKLGNIVNFKIFQIYKKY